MANKKLTREQIIEAFEQHSPNTIEFSILSREIAKGETILRKMKRKYSAMINLVNKEQDEVADKLDLIDSDWRDTIGDEKVLS